MKKILLLIFLFLNLVPYLENGIVKISGPDKAAAQGMGEEGGEVKVCGSSTSSSDTDGACMKTTTYTYITKDCETQEIYNTTYEYEYEYDQECLANQTGNGDCDPNDPNADCDNECDPNDPNADCNEEEECDPTQPGSPCYEDPGCGDGANCVEEPDYNYDCNGVIVGGAFRDICGNCVYGNTGKVVVQLYKDRDGDGWGDMFGDTKFCYQDVGWVSNDYDHNDDCYNVSNIRSQCIETKPQIKDTKCFGYDVMLSIQNQMGNATYATREVAGLLTTDGKVIILPVHVNNTDIKAIFKNTYDAVINGNTVRMQTIYKDAANNWVIDFNEWNSTGTEMTSTVTYTIEAFLHTHPSNGNENTPSPADKTFASDPKDGFPGSNYYILNSSNIVKYGPNGFISSIPFNTCQ